MASKSHIGKAGQLAAMAEFLLRGYNVAQPEVDLGDDIFVVEDESGQMSRIQVKTAIAKEMRYGWSGQLFIAEAQLEKEKRPELHYVMALRCDTQWEFVIVPRPLLHAEFVTHHVGTLNNAVITFTVRLRSNDVLCSSRSFQLYRNNWSTWPML